jgi:hypothetical protein
VGGRCHRGIEVDVRPRAQALRRTGLELRMAIAPEGDDDLQHGTAERLQPA